MRGVVPYVDTLVTPPTAEPLDLEITKKVLRFTSTSEDDLITGWIAAARQLFELETGHQVMLATRARTWRGTVLQPELELPYPRLQGVTSVTWRDGDDHDQALAEGDDYEVILPTGGLTAPLGRIQRVGACEWPSTGALICTYTCGHGGYDSPAIEVPDLIKSALYLLVGAFHKERSELRDGTVTKLPMGADAILRAFRDAALPRLGDEVCGIPEVG